MDAPLPIVKITPIQELKFDFKESFEIKSNEKNEKNFSFNISLSEKLIFFDIEEKGQFPKEDYNIYLSLEELNKINKYFLQFETLKEVFDSLKILLQKGNISIIKEEKKMKIKVINPGNNKEFFINIPLKEKDLKSEINSIIPYIISLNEKVNNLEKKLNEIYIYKKDLEELIKEKKEKEKDKEKDKDKEERENQIYKSSILNKNEISLFLSWLENKPKKIELLLDSKIDGGLTQTFYEKCSGKSPTVVLVKTTKGHRFGAYSTIPWKNQKGQYSSSNKNFIFSIDKNKKYKIVKTLNAVQSSDGYFGFFDFYLYNNCTSVNTNFVNSEKSYNTTEKYEINFGEQNFIVSSYEVYQIIY